jgi:hypothetical protein
LIQNFREEQHKVDIVVQQLQAGLQIQYQKAAQVKIDRQIKFVVTNYSNNFGRYFSALIPNLVSF